MGFHKITLSIILILAVAIIALSPSLRNGFTNWDDQAYVTQNADLKDFSPAGVRRICVSFYNAHYHPLTMLTYLWDYHLFKLDPRAYHATNLTQHLLNCVLVFWLLLMLSGSVIVAFVAAMFFAIHPVHVESIAWISERKDLLYGLFFLISLILYVYYLDRQKKIYYYLSLLGFILSLFSKAMAITLPAVLLLIDYLKKRKIGKEAMVEKIVFFELSFVFLIIGIFAQHDYGAIIQSSLLTAAHKIIIAAYAITFYLGKILLPLRLSCQYPFPRIAEITSWQYLIAPLIVAILAALVIFSRRYTRKIVFGALFFLVTIFSALQLIPFGSAVAADRYTYIASIGLFYLAGEFARYLYFRIGRSSKLYKSILVGIFIILVFILSFLSWQRCRVWHNSLSLWNDVLEKYPDSPIAYLNRADAYISQGDYEKAIGDCNRAIEITPNYSAVYLARSYAYFKKGDRDKASADYRQYVEITYFKSSK